MWRSTFGKLDARRLVFVDEMGTHTSLAPMYAYAPRGKRASFKVPRNRGKNTTLVASIGCGGMGPSMAVEGSTTKEVFEAYVEDFLAPMLRSGQVVVMDNLSAHKGERVRELIEERGCELLYLPPYSPDLNPIEEAFAKVKALLRKVAARSRGALVEAMGAALDAITAQTRTASSGIVATAHRSSPYARRFGSFRSIGAVTTLLPATPPGKPSTRRAIVSQLTTPHARRLSWPATQSGKPQHARNRKGWLSCPNW